MKSIKTISIFALAAFAFAGCQTELELTPASPFKVGEEITITASHEMGTKTCLGENNAVLWGIGDQISVFYGDGDNGGNQFISQNLAPAATAEFKGTLSTVTGVAEGNEPVAKKFWGVSPYNVGIALADGVITTSVPQLQDALENNFDFAGFPAVACSDNLSLPFRNAFGLLEITLEVEGVHSVVLNGHNDEVLWGPCSIALDNGIPVVTMTGDPASVNPYYLKVGIKSIGDDPLSTSCKYYLALPPTTFTDGVEIVLYDKELKEITHYSGEKEVKIERNKVHAVTLKKKELTIKTLWLKQSGETAWNTYFGGTGGTDRNIAMDDEYVYIAESAATAKLWAISIADPDIVKAVNVEGVADGGAHVLTCPRIVKNTDANVNEGKDVLICCSLTRGGVDPKLYIWNNGIDNAPKAVTLTTWATAAWYGDTFTVFGTLQDGVLFFDKTGSDSANNGIVTFLLKGVPAGDQMFLQARLKFNDAMGSHSGVCAYYPYPDNINTGVYSPGRGVEARGKNVTATGNIKGEGGIDIALENLDYDEGTNGYVLGYNFIEWEGKRYVIYGNQSSNKVGYIRVRQGASDTPWATIASTGTRLYRRDLVGADGCSLTSSNSAMDIAARVIDGDLYFVGQKQNIACGLYKLCYE
ncbi:MAG: hypothetical protein IKZ51_07270 [Bacteroidales bacterium]|nr:hypothetical protein [Bacteroidales bacterium]